MICIGNLYAANNNSFEKIYRSFDVARMSPSKFNLHSVENCHEIAVNSGKTTFYNGPLLKELSKNPKINKYMFDFRNIKYFEEKNEITADSGPFRFVKLSSHGLINIITWKLNTKENKDNKAYYRFYKNEINFKNKKADAVGECDIRNFDLSFRYPKFDG
jgi:hypothetical protein